MRIDNFILSIRKRYHIRLTNERKEENLIRKINKNGFSREYYIATEQSR